jgi:hypothetical protein
VGSTSADQEEIHNMKFFIRKMKIFILCSLVFNSCITYTIEEVGSINHSFPITNGIIEQGHIGIIKQNLFPFMKQALPNTEIIVIGRLHERSPEQVVWVEFKSKNESEFDTIIISGFRRENQWIGSTIIENKALYTTYDSIQISDLVSVKKLISQFYTFIRIIRQHHNKTDTRSEPLLVNQWRPN